MAGNVCMAAIFMMAGAVVQANQCSSGGESPSDEKSQNSVSLLQTKLHTSDVMSSSLTNGGTFTLQGRWFPRKSGVPMSCAIPICSRNCSQGAECCATQMFNALSEITSWMKENDVKYSLLFGTLLGAHRDKDIIQWTGDLDIGIYAKDVVKLTMQKDIPWSFGYQDSFTIPRGCDNNLDSSFPGKLSKFQMGGSGFCADGDPSCSYYVDLYVIDSPLHGGNIAKKCLASSLDSDGHLKQKVVEIRGKEFDAPAAVEDCLVAEYGADWKTPDSSESFHGL